MNRLFYCIEGMGNIGEEPSLIPITITTHLNLKSTEYKTVTTPSTVLDIGRLFGGTVGEKTTKNMSTDVISKSMENPTQFKEKLSSNKKSTKQAGAELSQS